MDYKSALEHFGGTQVKLAAALGITQPTVSSWKGVIPAPYQFQIEVLSDRALRVDSALINPVVQQPPALLPAGDSTGAVSD
jgi:hypothetical protein